jgi:hypothetical protein
MFETSLIFKTTENKFKPEVKARDNVEGVVLNVSELT